MSASGKQAGATQSVGETWQTVYLSAVCLSLGEVDLTSLVSLMRAESQSVFLSSYRGWINTAETWGGWAESAGVGVVSAGGVGVRLEVRVNTDLYYASIDHLHELFKSIHFSVIILSHHHLIVLHTTVNCTWSQI